MTDIASAKLRIYFLSCNFFRENLFFFALLAEFGVYLQQRCREERHRAEYHDDDEEHAIAHQLLQGSGKQSWYHHRQCHEGCAEGIVARLFFSPALIYKV